jgi:hypothetical protein
MKHNIPQKSILSPLLCNIYLNQFDTWMETNINEYKKNNTIAPLLATGYIKTVKKKLKHANEEVDKSHQINSGINILYHTVNNNFRQMRYARYADDFIIGINGSKEDCTKQKQKIISFMTNELKFDFNEEKIKITHAITELTNFLDTDIRLTSYNKQPIKKIFSKNIKITHHIQMLAPITKIVNTLKQNGFLINDRITGIPKLQKFEESKIVNYYNTIAAKILNYYTFVYNYTRTCTRINYILKYSCALTLARKMKLKTKKKVFQKYGINLTIKNEQNKIITQYYINTALTKNEHKKKK